MGWLRNLSREKRDSDLYQRVHCDARGGTARPRRNLQFSVGGMPFIDRNSVA